MRFCDICGKPMVEGYVIGDGLEYYCSDECLHEVMTEEEYREWYEDDCAYWTEWEDDMVMDFEEFGTLDWIEPSDKLEIYTQAEGDDGEMYDLVRDEYGEWRFTTFDRWSKGE